MVSLILYFSLGSIIKNKSYIIKLSTNKSTMGKNCDLFVKGLSVFFIIFIAACAVKIKLSQMRYLYEKALIRQHLKQDRNSLLCENHIEELSRQRCEINLGLPFNQNQFTLADQKHELKVTFNSIKDRLKYHMENKGVNPWMYKAIVKSLNTTVTILKTALDRFDEWDTIMLQSTQYAIQDILRVTQIKSP
jgi:hypothetical protein